MTVLLVVMGLLSADARVDLMAHGNKAYAAGDLDVAAVAYEQLAAEGVWDERIYFNLGNIRYHQGDWGRAVLNYERALALNPDHENARRHLALAVGSTAHRLDRPTRFALDHERPSRLPGLTQRGLTALMLTLWWAVWGILIFRKRITALSRIPVPALVALALFCALALIVPAPPWRSAVIVDATVPLRYGPDDRDPSRGSLAAGDRVVCDRVASGWARVETAEGLRGWVAVNTLAWAGPPFLSTDPEGGTASP